MLGEERLITGPEAGITRDSIAVDWLWTAPDGSERPVRLIDTAGMRKSAKVEDKLEKLAVADARRAVDFAEVVVLLLDATLGLEAQDLRIADNVLQEGRALIIAINKWDVAEDASGLFNGIRAALDEGLAQARGVPLLTVSAATGKGLDHLLAAAFEMREAWSRRVPTGELNRWFEAAIEKNPPPAPGGKRIKLRYITQVATRPPTFVLFGTRTDELPESYRRYLVNGIRKELGFGAVPVRLNLRSSAIRSTARPPKRTGSSVTLAMVRVARVNRLFTVGELVRPATGMERRDVLDDATDDVVDWSTFSSVRAELGANFVRILGYFREDGEKSVARIEEAMHAKDAAAMVMPAHTMKSEARQFGAMPLADAGRGDRGVGAPRRRDPPVPRRDPAAGRASCARSTSRPSTCSRSAPIRCSAPPFGRRAGNRTSAGFGRRLAAPCRRIGSIRPRARLRHSHSNGP